MHKIPSNPYNFDDSLHIKPTIAPQVMHVESKFRESPHVFDTYIMQCAFSKMDLKVPKHACHRYTCSNFYRWYVRLYVGMDGCDGHGPHVIFMAVGCHDARNQRMSLWGCNMGWWGGQGGRHGHYVWDGGAVVTKLTWRCSVTQGYEGACYEVGRVGVRAWLPRLLGARQTYDEPQFFKTKLRPLGLIHC